MSLMHTTCVHTEKSKTVDRIEQIYIPTNYSYFYLLCVFYASCMEWKIMPNFFTSLLLWRRNNGNH